MSKITDAIMEFRAKIMAETGHSRLGVVKIGLHPEVFDRLCFELAENTNRMWRFPTMQDIGCPLRIADIEIVRKLPEDF